MALSGGDQSVQVLISSKADTKGIKDTNDALGHLDKSSDGSSGALGKLGSAAKIAAVGIAAVGTALGAAATFGVKSAADFQQTRIGLENMLGSADKARSLLRDISDFAAETPFEFPELAGAAKQLVAFGFTGDNAFKTMKQLGDVSAAIGAPIGDLSYLMGTLKTQGRAFTVDIRQFAQRGVPIYEYLAKVLKTNEKNLSGMIEAGKVGFPEVQKAFEMMTGEGGKFNGAMAKQSKSLNGLFSTLKDNLGQTARELVGLTQEGDIKPGSLFDWLQKGATKATILLPEIIKKVTDSVSNLKNGFLNMGIKSTDKLDLLMQKIGSLARAVYDYLRPKVVALWHTIKEDLAPALMQFWHDVIEPIIPILAVTLVGAIGFVIDQLNAWYKVLSPLLTFIADNEYIVYGLAGAFIAVKAAMFLDDGVKAFSAAMAIVRGEAALTNTSLMTIKTLVSNPLTWAIAVALVGFTVVMDQIGKLNKAIDGANEAIEKRDINKYIETYNNIKKRDPEAAKRYAESQSRAGGGHVSAGNAYLVGDNADGTPNATSEIFVPNSSGTIIPAKKTQELLNGGAGGSSNTYNIQNVTLSTAEAAKVFFGLNDRNGVLASKGLSTVRM